MESTESYNFSIFSPRNKHGRKNRNVILSMLVIWFLAVFGFQVLLRIIEKPTPEESLKIFESAWPSVMTGESGQESYRSLLKSLVHVRGKNIVKASDQDVLNAAISHSAFKILPDSLRKTVNAEIQSLAELRSGLNTKDDEQLLDLRRTISAKYSSLAALFGPSTGFVPDGLEATILVRSLNMKYPESPGDESLSSLPEIMKLYLTHNQSVLTDTKFAGFPFHYFYTAVFLLLLFVSLCIIYNILIEWRLRKEGITE
jgi:uncharacterized membrane protein